MESFAHEWNEFQRAVLPLDAGPVQREMMRDAFYAGGAIVIQLLLRITDSPLNNPTQEAHEAEQLDRLNEEIMAHIQRPRP